MASLKSVIDGMRRDNAYSPDIGWIERNYSYVPVFVYGTQMKHYSDEAAMQGFPRLGIANTVRARFVMYRSREHEPVVFDMPQDAGASPIRGELYVVPPKVLWCLDGLACRGVHFYRRIEPVSFYNPQDLLTPNPKTYETDAWMYIGLEEPWRKAIEGGTIQRMGRLLDAKQKMYFRFTVGDDAPNKQSMHTHVM